MVLNPQNEFEHKSSLTNVENPYEKERKVGKYSILVSKPHLLSNINNDELMRIYQRDAANLTHLMSMADRDSRLMPVFEVLSNAWQHELSLTRTKNGEERKHQARVGGNYQPREQLTGYGNDLPMFNPEEENQDLISKAKNLITRGKR